MLRKQALRWFYRIHHHVCHHIFIALNGQGALALREKMNLGISALGRVSILTPLSQGGARITRCTLMWLKNSPS